MHSKNIIVDLFRQSLHNDGDTRAVDNWNSNIIVISLSYWQAFVTSMTSTKFLLQVFKETSVVTRKIMLLLVVEFSWSVLVTILVVLFCFTVCRYL